MFKLFQLLHLASNTTYLTVTAAQLLSLHANLLNLSLLFAQSDGFGQSLNVFNLVLVIVFDITRLAPRDNLVIVEWSIDFFNVKYYEPKSIDRFRQVVSSGKVALHLQNHSSRSNWNIF